MTITFDQWNAMTPQAQFDLVCLLDSMVDDAVDDVENGEQVLISREWVTAAKGWLPEVDEPEGEDMDKSQIIVVKINGQDVELKTTRHFPQVIEKLYAHLLAASDAVERMNAKKIEDEPEGIAEEETQPTKHQPWWEVPHEIDWNKTDD